MLSKQFLHNNLGSKLWLVVGSIITIIAYFFYSKIESTSGVSMPEWLSYLLSTALLIATILIAIPLYNNGYKIFKRNSLLGLTILLFWGTIPQMFTIELSFSLFLFIALLDGLFRVSEQAQKNSIPYLINVTIISFIAFLISPIGWLFLLLILINNFLYANISLREILIPIYIFVFSLGVTYAFNILLENPGYLLELWNRNLPQGFSVDIFSTYKNSYILLISTFALSLLGVFNSLNKVSVLQRKAILVLVLQFVLFFFFSFWFGEFAPYFLGVATIVVAILFSNYLQNLRKYWMKEIWVWILVALNVLQILVLK